MTENELIERTRQAIAELNSLPPEEYFRKPVEWGIVDDNGELLFGREEARMQEELAKRNANGTAE